MYALFAGTGRPLGDTQHWSFGSSQPLIVPNKQRGRNSRQGVLQGHYYCQADKIGAITRRTSIPKHTKLLVRPQWVHELYAMRKMSHAAFVREIIAARGRAKG
jgi:hypothetical protein